MKHIIIIAIALTACLIPSHAGVLDLPPDATAQSLEELGNRHFAENRLDSALMCFLIVAENDALPGSRRDIRAKAYNRCGHLYYMRHNQPAAYRCFLNAIGEEDEYESNRAKIYIAVIYSLLGDYPKMMEYYRETWDYTLAHRDYTNFLTIHANMLNSAFANDQLISEVKMMKAFQAIDYIPDSPLYRSVAAANKGMLDVVERRYDSAIANFSHSAESIGDSTSLMPYRVTAHENIAKAQALNGDLKGAIASLATANAIAQSNNLLEMKASNLNLMADYLEKQGDHEGAVNTRARYVMLRDSIMNVADINSLHNLQSSFDINIVRDELFQANLKMQMQRRLLVGAGVFATVLIALLTLLLLTHRKMRGNMRALYFRNTELMGLAQGGASQNTPVERSDWELGRQKGDEILAAVENVMADPSNYCSADFSMEQLSRIAGYNTKYVSMVINQRLGKTFRQWLAEKRIRQACVIMRSAEGRDMSAETLADRVGVRSRSNFSSLFKNITGMSPKEFQKQAHAQE